MLRLWTVGPTLFPRCDKHTARSLLAQARPMYDLILVTGHHSMSVLDDHRCVYRGTSRSRPEKLTFFGSWSSGPPSPSRSLSGDTGRGPPGFRAHLLCESATTARVLHACEYLGGFWWARVLHYPGRMFMLFIRSGCRPHALVITTDRLAGPSGNWHTNLRDRGEVLGIGFLLVSFRDENKKKKTESRTVQFLFLIVAN